MFSCFSTLKHYSVTTLKRESDLSVYSTRLLYYRKEFLYMASFKGVELSRQGILKNSRQGKVNFRDVIYLIQAYTGLNVRTYRTENPARALTVCKPFVERAYTVQITVWIRVGIDCMIPMTYVACSHRDLANAFEHITSDIACALKSSQVDETREQIRKEEREEADKEIPNWKFPEFMTESEGI